MLIIAMPKSPITIGNFLVPPSTESALFVAQQNQLVECLGTIPSGVLGELKKDYGYGIIGSQIHAGASILGLTLFNQDASTHKLLASMTNSGNTELWYNTGSAWSQITATAWNGFVGQRVEFAPYLGYEYMVGSAAGATFLPSATLTGTTFSTTVNTQGMAQGKYIKQYRDRLYIAGTKLLISSTLSANVPVGSSYIDVTDLTRFPDGGVSGQISFNSDTGVVYTSKLPVDTVPQVLVATAGALPACSYIDQQNGVGAILIASALGTLTVDGVVVNLGDRVLVKNQAAGLQNGIYTCTAVGDATHVFVLTRSIDSDQSLEIFRAVVYISNGSTNANTHYRNENTAPPTMGSTSITYGIATGTSSLYGVPQSGAGSVTSAGTSGSTINYGSSTLYPYRVYFSNVPVAGVVTWSPDVNFFDVDYSTQITGMGSNWDRLILFTPNGGFMYDQVSLKKLWDKGCVAHRTIRNYEAYMVWMADDNVYASVSGGRPTAIGNDILQLIRNSAQLTFGPDDTLLCAEVIGAEYHLHLGATSANGIDYTNCVATYNFDRGMWRWREYADPPTVFTTTGNIFGLEQLAFGDTDGKVYRKSTGFTADNGLPILSRWKTKPMDLGSPEILKAATTVLAYATAPNGLQLNFRIYSEEGIGPWEELGKLQNFATKFEDRLDGNFVQFEGIQYGIGDPYAFNGFTFLAEAVETQN